MTALRHDIGLPHLHPGLDQPRDGPERQDAERGKEIAVWHLSVDQKHDDLNGMKGVDLVLGQVQPTLEQTDPGHRCDQRPIDQAQPDPMHAQSPARAIHWPRFDG